MGAIKKTIVEMIEDCLIKNVEFGFSMSEGEFSDFVSRNTRIAIGDDSRKISIEITIPVIHVVSCSNSYGNK